MSKRLENMKSTIKLIKEYVDAETHHFETLALATEIILNHGDWLIEQAEQKQSLETAVDFYQSALRDADRRVQELEVKKDEFKKWWQDEAHYNNELIEQNKRYREAIEDIKNVWKVTDTHQEYMDTIHDIIKDLEGEE